MIKVFLFPLLIIINSCASINYSYFTDFKNAISRNELIIDDLFIENQDFSFIKVSNSKNDAVFVLASISSVGIYEWIGANYERIRTKDGLILETVGLESDIKFYSNLLITHNNKGIFNSHIDLYNPDLVFEEISLQHHSSKTHFTENGDKVVTSKFLRTSSAIGWRSEDIYVYKNGIIQRSVQEINPLTGPLEIEFYFKY
ncbi:hypothetical protein B273_0603 [SAR86 cluster bacterium SAR86E]|uniref:Lipoprotein n=1 Tax=SAR86 cluster bacterium SAR86E TaxID=1208365 RepID=K6H0A0_9GAMM|nr:hypothetical protein B273_0603 [SAR86 cluster bacterium SAR86E]